MKGLLHYVESYLDSIDPSKYLTYEAYLIDANKHSVSPISQEQWDSLISTLGNRKLQYTSTVNQWLKNIRVKITEDKR